METLVKPPRSEKREISIWSIVKITLGLILVVFVLSKTSLAEITTLAGQVSWGWLGATFVLFLLLSVLKALQYHLLFDGKFPYLQILSVVILQNAISNFVASSAGIAAYLTVLRAEQGVKVSRSASIFIVTKVGDLIAIWLGLIISCFFVWNQVGVVHNLILFLIAIIATGLSVFGATVLLRRKFIDMLQMLFERIGLQKYRMIQHILKLANTVAELEQKDVIRIMMIASGLSCLYLLFTFIWIYASLHTFNLSVALWAVAFVSSMLQLLSIVPVQVFGGLGVVEVASIYFFGLFGFSQGQLATVMIGIRLLFYLTNLVVLIYLPLYPFLQNCSFRKNR